MDAFRAPKTITTADPVSTIPVAFAGTEPPVNMYARPRRFRQFRQGGFRIERHLAAEYFRTHLDD